MSRFGIFLKRSARPVGLGFGLIAVAGLAVWVSTLLPTKAGGHTAEKGAGPEPEKIHRVTPDTYQLPAGMLRRVGLDTTVVAAANRPRTLPPFQGNLAPDNSRYVRVHSLFAGSVMSIAPADPATGSGNPLDVGGAVKKGQLLAVIWSKDLGEKKSELATALSQLWRDEKLHQALKDAERSGATSPVAVLNARNAVEQDRQAVAKAERTLHAWQVSDDEIKVVYDEAKRVAAGAEPSKTAPASATWARVEIRSAIDGTILEKNVNPGDVVDTTTDLFRVVDLTRLAVWVHVFEEDLPVLQALPKPIRWTVTVPSREGTATTGAKKAFPGTIDRIGAVIDPTQHTALVVGRVENPNGELKVGQFITATVELPPQPGEVELPTDAVIEDGIQSVVYVQDPKDQTLYKRVLVSVTRRLREVVYARVEPNGVKPGDRVVTSGSLLLENTADQLPAPK